MSRVDPVVTYGSMRFAANRLSATYAEKVTIGGLQDPAIAEMLRIKSEVRAVDPRDLEAQIQMTESLFARYEARCLES